MSRVSVGSQVTVSDETLLDGTVSKGFRGVVLREHNRGETYHSFDITPDGKELVKTVAGVHGGNLMLDRLPRSILAKRVR